MTNSSYENQRYFKLEEGLAIFLPNKRSKTWRMRCREDGQEVRLSLQTQDFKTARRRAYLYKENPETTEFNPARAGRTTFKKFDEDLRAALTYKFSKNTIKGIMRQYEKIFMYHFGDTDINSLSKKDFVKIISENDYPKTALRDFKMCTNAVFEHLEDENLIERKPTFPKLDKIVSNYDPFTVTEIKFIYDHSKELLGGGNKHYKKRHEGFEEFLLYQSIMTYQGTRPGEEVLEVRLRDFEFSINEETEVISWYLKIVNGKNKDRGGVRLIPLQDQVVFSILNYQLAYDKENEYASGLNWAINIRDAEINFIKECAKNPNNKLFTRITHRMLTDLLTTCMNAGRKLKPSLFAGERKLSQYSYRHSYITRALRQKMDIYLLAKNCGTSVAMIEKNYSSMEVIDRKDEILEFNLE